MFVFVFSIVDIGCYIHFRCIHGHNFSIHLAMFTRSIAIIYHHTMILQYQKSNKSYSEWSKTQIHLSGIQIINVSMCEDNIRTSGSSHSLILDYFHILCVCIHAFMIYTHTYINSAENILWNVELHVFWGKNYFQ